MWYCSNTFAQVNRVQMKGRGRYDQENVRVRVALSSAHHSQKNDRLGLDTRRRRCLPKEGVSGRRGGGVGRDHRVRGLVGSKTNKPWSQRAATVCWAVSCASNLVQAHHCKITARTWGRGRTGILKWAVRLYSSFTCIHFLVDVSLSSHLCPS